MDNKMCHQDNSFTPETGSLPSSYFQYKYVMITNSGNYFGFLVENSGKLFKLVNWESEWEEGINRICDLDVARDRTKYKGGHQYRHLHRHRKRVPNLPKGLERKN